MQVIDKTPSLLAALKSFPTFEKISDSALNWLIDQSEYQHFEKGELLFQSGDKVDHMSILMKGHYLIYVEQNGRTRELGEWETGEIFGVLPFSRMTEARAFGKALEDCYVLHLHRSCFIEMVNVSYDLTQSLVAVMSTRIREFTQQRTQEEKLMALGKLSAGLAHELNNPISAIVSSSEELYTRIHQTPERFKSVITMKITPEETDQINEMLVDKKEQKNLGILEREEKMDDILDWLEDHDIADGEDISETFVEFGIGVADLTKVQDAFVGRNTEPLMWWIQSSLNLERLVKDIRNSSKRISELIQAIKAYSHMDRDVSMELIDIHDGLRSTMAILKHKWKSKNIGVVKEVNKEIPNIRAYGGELNQVWTNIIVNAIEAMDEGGTLTIRTYQERDHICVDIEDNGPGIPEENLNRIFDPFFTTKDVDKGTGIGLDIVKRIINRHHGSISVESEAGKTLFQICLPIASKAAEKQ